MDTHNREWNNYEHYNSFMGKWSDLVAEEFLNWLSSEYETKGQKWLDVGCGTGAISRKIIYRLNPSHILGIDPSAYYLPRDFSNNKKIVFEVGYADRINLPNDNRDFAVSGLALNFIDNKETCIREILRTIKTGGVISLYVWDYSNKMEFLRYFWDAVVRLDQAASLFDEGVMFPICNIEPLIDLFTTCHVKKIETKIIDIQTNFSSFKEYWNPFQGGQGPAGKYVASLSITHRDELKQELRNSIPISPDGSISLVARAFGIRGIK